MAIIMRNGLAANFDPNKMRAGELAIVTDARELHATFAPGDSPKVLLDGEAVPNPETAGTEGQVLALDENGDPEWKSVAAPSDAQVEAAVTDWLDEHPEATTTVEDGAITYAKLDSNLKGTVDEVGELKSDLNAISEPGSSISYFTEFTGNKYGAGVYIQRVSASKIKIWNAGTGWVRINELLGNDEITSSYPTFTNNLQAGTYTLKAETDKLYVFYGTSWDNRTRWENGETITLDSACMVWLSSLTSNQDFGTENSPTTFELEIYPGQVSIQPTAIDTVARGLIANDIGTVSYNRALAKADFDYAEPYNIFKGTTYTANKYVDYLTGDLEDDSNGRLATDYMEIDNTKEYLCLNISVQLSGETGEGLVTGANRVWAHQGWAFYDANKQYIRTNNTAAEQSSASKSIPSNAKYVRLTVWNEAIIPYIVLFYGYYTTAQYVRYREYRKEIVEKSVYSDTGMESLNMVMFGDSITFGYDIGATSISYINFANDYLRSNIINVGLGGSRMSQGSPDTIGLGSFASLCENIVSTSATAWDALEAWCTSTGRTDWLYQIATLKAIDWSKMQAIGIWYGANDWHNNVPVGNTYSEDPTTYDGACAYGIKLLLTKYPHLQVLIFTPLYRVIDATHTGDDQNGAGLTIFDYGAALKNVQIVAHCPVVDSGNELGINRYTIYSYTATNDGTHPRKLLGNLRIGRFFAESIKRFIQPY